MVTVRDGLTAFLTDVKSLVQESINDRVDIDQSDIVKSHFICPLCQGYFYDATTIADCLHTFCKPCIVKHFSNIRNPKACPSCKNPTHGTNPFESLRPDRQIQDLLYAIVPEAFEEELKIEKSFWTEKGLPLPEKILNLTADVNFNNQESTQNLNIEDISRNDQEIDGAVANGTLSQNVLDGTTLHTLEDSLGDHSSSIVGLQSMDVDDPETLNYFKQQSSQHDITATTSHSNINNVIENMAINSINQNFPIYEEITKKYHNPFNYIDLSASHLSKNHQIIKFKLCGKMKKEDLEEKVHIVKCSERANVVELKNVILEIYRRSHIDGEEFGWGGFSHIYILIQKQHSHYQQFLM